MRNFLILSSAAIVLAGCSMDGKGSYYDPGMYGKTGSAAYNYNCGFGNCASGSTYAVSNQTPAPHYGQQAAHSGAAQQPSAHAYGTQVQGHPAYHGGHGAPQLRGRHNPRKQAYKYGNLGAVMYDTDADLYGIQGRLGYQSAGIFGAELEGSVGLKGESETLAGTTTDLDVDYSLGAFAVARAPIGNRFSVHSRLGYAATQFSSEIDDGVTVVENSDTFDGLAYGIGAEYAFDPRNAIRLDYTRYDYDGGPGEADSLSLAFARKF